MQNNEKVKTISAKHVKGLNWLRVWKSIPVIAPKNTAIIRGKIATLIGSIKVTLKYEGFSFSDTDDYIYRLKINSSPSLIVSESGEYMEDDTWTVFITR